MFIVGKPMMLFQFRTENTLLNISENRFLRTTTTTTTATTATATTTTTTTAAATTTATATTTTGAPR